MLVYRALYAAWPGKKAAPAPYNVAASNGSQDLSQLDKPLAGQSYSILWSGAGSGRGRTLVSTTSPKLPAWVSAQGLTLSVTVSFTLLSDGTTGGVSLQQSSGYADVDASVVDAIRRWRFTSVEGAPPARGTIPYVIQAR